MIQVITFESLSKKCPKYLKENFPEMYGIAWERDVSVTELISFSGETYHCNVNFIRSGQDWELESVASFMDLLYYGV